MKVTPLQHITVLYLLIVISSYIVIVAGKRYIYDEHELVENLQAIVLLVSSVVFLISLHGAKQPLRILLFAGFLFFLSLFLREVDFEKLKLPTALVLVTSGHGRNIILLSLWLVVLGIMIEHVRYHLSKLRQLLFSSAGALYVLGGLFLLLGEYLDSLSKSLRFYEELSEVAGYYFMFIGALYTPATLSPPG